MIGTATLTIYGWAYSWNTEMPVANGTYSMLPEAFNVNASAFGSGGSASP